MVTTIALDENTRDVLRNLGTKGETYDEIIMRLTIAYEDFIERQYKRFGEKHKFKKMVL
jgi:hypothetical protein